MPALAGCGSAPDRELPPPAGPALAPPAAIPPAGRIVPAAGGAARAASVPIAARLVTVDGARALATVQGRGRRLVLSDPRTRRPLASAPAGVGPTNVIAAGGRLYVADTRGGALLVFVTRPALALVRRVFLPGGPYALAVDPVRHRLWVTLTARNEVVSLPANGRPRPLVRLPTVRGPVRVAVDPARGALAVSGRDAGVVQVIDAAAAYPAGRG